MILRILGVKKTNLAPPHRKRRKSLHENPYPTAPRSSAPVGPEVFIKRSVIEVSTKPGVKEQLWMPRGTTVPLIDVKSQEEVGLTHPCG